MTILPYRSTTARHVTRCKNTYETKVPLTPDEDAEVWQHAEDAHAHVGDGQIAKEEVGNCSKLFSLQENDQHQSVS